MNYEPDEGHNIIVNALTIILEQSIVSLRCICKNVRVESIEERSVRRISNNIKQIQN